MTTFKEYWETTGEKSAIKMGIHGDVVRVVAAEAWVAACDLAMGFVRETIEVIDRREADLVAKKTEETKP